MTAELDRRQKVKSALGVHYDFRGVLQEFQEFRDHEIIVSGPAETGKTLAILYRLHYLALRYPLQAVIVRKVYADLHSSVLQTFQRKILGESPIRIFGGERANWYDYPSGARIWVGGMDNPGKVLSSEYDIVYVNQAEELNEEDWETLTTRTTGRAGNLPFAACWGDCNPRNQGHWILQRAKKGILKLLPTTHKDNPALYTDTGELTEQGKQTIGRLSNLTGVRLRRLFRGEWVTPEGIIYDEFDRAIHVRTRDAKEFQYFMLALDAGYDNPSVILSVGVDFDLRRHVFHKFYQSGVLPSRHASATFQWSHRWHAGVAIVDPSAAGLIAELRNMGIKVETPEIRDVERGIDIMHELLAKQGDGKPRFTADPSVVNLINEFESYKRNKGRIVKETDHALDACRYLATWLFADEFESKEIRYDRVQIGEKW